jgi:hypothetical protein
MKLAEKIILLVIFSTFVSNAQYVIPSSVLANGGGMMSSANYTTNGTIGQMITGPSAGSSYKQGAGFWYTKQDVVTGIEQVHDLVPLDFRLFQNYPNPFNPATIIRFSIPEVSQVSLRVYDILGNLVADLFNGETAPGYYQAAFNAANLASGVYFYRLESSGKVQVMKMTLLK